jgi:molybdopterin synthase catalytic subunit
LKYPAAVRVRVLFFAGLREALGRKELDVDLDAPLSLGQLLEQLRREHPAVERYRDRLLVSLNEERRPLETQLADGDEVALLPPMSGGSDRPWVQSAPLSLDALLAEVRGPGVGGIVTFIGTVRDHARGKTIDHLEYEAYVPMAEKEMRRIAEQAGERWPGVRVAMAHRIGSLAIGEAAVMIVAAAAHRGEAFEACRYVIDTLKRTVPIWKKEFASEGSVWIEENP